MRNTLIFLLALFTIISNPAFSAASISFDSDSEKVIINGVELGKKVTVTQSDLASAIAARTDGQSDGTSELELLFTFADDSQTKILNFIDGGFEVVNRPELRVIKTADPAAYSTTLEYALVDSSKVATGALTAAGPRTTETSSGETNYVFRIQDLRNSRGNRIPIMYHVIDSALTYSGNFEIIFNFFSADETIEGTLQEDASDNNNNSEDDSSNNDSSDNSETIAALQGSLQTSMFDAADTEVEIYQKINYTFNCETALDGTTLNICDTDELELLNTELQESLDLISSSRDALQSAFRTTREIKKEKAISTIERK